MVVATMGGEGLGDNGQTRIQAVSRALDELVAKGAEYSRQGAGQSAGSLLKVFMYGFGFGGVNASVIFSKA